MSFEHNKIYKIDIDHYLYEIAKEYKKANRLYSDAELVLVGGASMIINYNCREMTTDIDSIIKASSNIKDIINKVGDKYNLENGWLNDDFKNTKSYSPKIAIYSKFYKKFCNCLSVRTLKDEYLIAMKLCSARIYKHDLSDMVGIILDNQAKDTPLSIEMIDTAMKNLYGNWERVDKDAKEFIENVFKQEDLESYYYDIVCEEKTNKDALLKAQEKYKNDITHENSKHFIDHFRLNKVHDTSVIDDEEAEDIENEPQM